jgi:hypothetical protein
MNHNRYRVVCWWNDWPFGTDNTIVASAATLKGCLSEYRRFSQSCELMKVRPLHTFIYCDGKKLDIQLEGSNHA